MDLRKEIIVGQVVSWIEKTFSKDGGTSFTLGDIGKKIREAASKVDIEKLNFENGCLELKLKFKTKE